MPRLPRINLDGAIYYVIARSNENEVVFKDKEDYKMYLDLVNKYKAQHKFKLFSYNLLQDRLELLIETSDDASISEIMHDLNSLYTKYYNGRYSRHGHLFEARFRSVLVEKATSLLALTRHIHLRDTQNPYSSFHIYTQMVGAGSPRPQDHQGAATAPLQLGAEIDEVKNFLSDKDNPNAYEKYVLEADPKELKTIEKSLSRGSVYGSENFRRAVMNRVQEHTQELQKAAKAKKVSPIFLYMIGGLVLLAMGSTLYLYISKTKIQTQYAQLLNQKEEEFFEKTRFENQSPLLLTELEGTSWDIELVDPDRGTIQQDAIRFEDGKFHSRNMETQGYSEATYLLVPQSKGVVKWQSAQTNVSGQTLYWQGIWQGGAMKGQMTLKSGSKESVFSFYSVRWSYAESVQGSSGGGAK